MQPFYFGTSDRQLFGMYVPPLSIERSNAGSVVICPPIADEYMTMHWSLVQLSNLLANAGCHVLRFDYFGTGDSAGEFANADVGAWISDIEIAAKELIAISGNQTVTLLGLRFGALLAINASTAPSIDRVIAWEPLQSGEHYLHQLAQANTRRLSRYESRFHRSAAITDGVELTGYVFSERLLDSIRPLSFAAGATNSKTRPQIVLSSKKSLPNGLMAEDPVVHNVSDGADWLASLKRLERVHAPQSVLETLVQVVAC